MTQANIDMNGDLYIIFKKENIDDVLTSYKLNNGAEFDFYNDELVQLILPNFEAQLNRGSLLGLSIEVLDIKIEDTKLILPIQIMNDVINIKLDCESIIHKI